MDVNYFQRKETFFSGETVPKLLHFYFPFTSRRWVWSCKSVHIIHDASVIYSPSRPAPFLPSLCTLSGCTNLCVVRAGGVGKRREMCASAVSGKTGRQRDGREGERTMVILTVGFVPRDQFTLAGVVRQGSTRRRQFMKHMKWSTHKAMVCVDWFSPSQPYYLRFLLRTGRFLLLCFISCC